MNRNRFGTGIVGTGTDGIKPKPGTGSVRFEVIGTVVNLTEPFVSCTLGNYVVQSSRSMHPERNCALLPEMEASAFQLPRLMSFSLNIMLRVFSTPVPG